MRRFNRSHHFLFQILPREITVMSVVFNVFTLPFVLICMDTNDVVFGLREGVRCRDPNSDKFLFHYYNTEAYICRDFKQVQVTGYGGGCKHEGRPVFRYRNNAWQTCLDGTTFTDLACVFDEECALKSDLISFGLDGWTTPSADGSCNRLRGSMLADSNKYKRMVPKFSTCHFGDYVTKTNFLTCNFNNYSQSGHDPDDCRNGPDKYVFFVDNKPEYCIIRTRDAFNGLCLPMERLWQVLKTNYSTYASREHTRASNYEYKRYAIENKMKMYNVNYGGAEGDLKTIFKTMATHLTTYFPEIHSFQLDDTKIGANVFCEVALKSFPIESYQIYQALLPQKCPCIKNECVNRQSSALINSAPYPKNLYKIWFTENKLPLKCFLPQHFHGRTDGKNYCINFASGAALINTRANDRTNWEASKNDYQASLLRVLIDPPNYQTPWHLRFDARSAEPLAKVLRDMADALGYYNERHEVVQFTVGGETVKLGASTFCSILVEMIPFYYTELQGASEEC